MIPDLVYHTGILAIVGDILKVRARGVGFGDLAVVQNGDDEESLAQVVRLDRDEVSLQVFGGGKGLSTAARVRFLGHPARVTYSAKSSVGCSVGPGSRWTGGRPGPATPVAGGLLLVRPVLRWAEIDAALRE